MFGFIPLLSTAASTIGSILPWKARALIRSYLLRYLLLVLLIAQFAYKGVLRVKLIFQVLNLRLKIVNHSIIFWVILILLMIESVGSYLINAESIFFSGVGPWNCWILELFHVLKVGFDSFKALCFIPLLERKAQVANH